MAPQDCYASTGCVSELSALAVSAPSERRVGSHDELHWPLGQRSAARRVVAAEEDQRRAHRRDRDRARACEACPFVVAARKARGARVDDALRARLPRRVVGRLHVARVPRHERVDDRRAGLSGGVPGAQRERGLRRIHELDVDVWMIRRRREESVRTRAAHALAGDRRTERIDRAHGVARSAGNDELEVELASHDDEKLARCVRRRTSASRTVRRRRTARGPCNPSRRRARVHRLTGACARRPRAILVCTFARVPQLPHASVSFVPGRQPPTSSLTRTSSNRSRRCRGEPSDTKAERFLRSGTRRTAVRRPRSASCTGRRYSAQACLRRRPTLSRRPCPRLSSRRPRPCPRIVRRRRRIDLAGGSFEPAPSSARARPVMRRRS